jgi:ribose 5-phosphate isomerase B
MLMKLYIASDHAGFEYKNKIINYLKAKNLSVEDMGALTLDDSDDYPDLIAPLAIKISEAEKTGLAAMGIILGGSGQGEAIVANRFAGVRAGVYNCNNIELVKLMREHNDANIISFGARFISESELLEALDIFLTTSFTKDARHVRRIKEIDIVCE